LTDRSDGVASEDLDADSQIVQDAKAAGIDDTTIQEVLNEAGVDEPVEDASEPAQAEEPAESSTDVVQDAGSEGAPLTEVMARLEKLESETIPALQSGRDRATARAQSAEGQLATLERQRQDDQRKQYLDMDDALLGKTIKGELQRPISPEELKKQAVAEQVADQLRGLRPFYDSDESYKEAIAGISSVVDISELRDVLVATRTRAQLDTTMKAQSNGQAAEQVARDAAKEIPDSGESGTAGGNFNDMLTAWSENEDANFEDLERIVEAGGREGALGKEDLELAQTAFGRD